MTPTHTPGPWITENKGTTLQAVHIPGVAFLRIPKEADANLIAAAPDLLSALQEAVVCLDLYQSECPLREQGRILAVLRNCNAAIAKAEGR